MGKLLAKGAKYLFGQQALNPQNAPETFAKIGRKLYVGSAATIALAWYTGWRRLRNDPKGTFPIPGLAKRRKGKASRLSDLPALMPFKAVLPLVTGVTDVTGSGATPSLGGTPPGASGFLGGKAPNLIELAHIAQRYGLRVSENPLFGGVTAVHTATSLHYRGRAFDCSGTVAQMSAFANFVAQNYGSRMTELFWRGPGWINIKNGAKQGRNFVDGHTDHVHVAV